MGGNDRIRVKEITKMKLDPKIIMTMLLIMFGLAILLKLAMKSEPFLPYGLLGFAMIFAPALFAIEK
jgi:hypothetical protein